MAEFPSNISSLYLNDLKFNK